MKLIQTTFNHFRCYNNFELQYGKEATVFIGKNGTGKSSILSAIRRGLSIFFMDSKKFSKNLNFANTAKVKKYAVKDFKFDDINRVFATNIENKFKADLDNQTITWSLKQRTLTGNPEKEYYAIAATALSSRYNEQPDSKLPLFAVYSDNFPHVIQKQKSEIRELIQLDIMPRDFGYYKWDKDHIIPLWVNRYIKAANVEKDLCDDIEEVEKQIRSTNITISALTNFGSKEMENAQTKIRNLESRKKQLLNIDTRKQQFEVERSLIESAFITFTAPLSPEYNFINEELEVTSLSVNRPDKREFELTFNFKDQRHIMFETLPMGYKRIFSIILDIAYRSYILNGNLDSDGVVLIDEIELHLHPSLQQEILNRLKKTFPKLQFIVTTHSPLVISNFKTDTNNKIIKLSQENNEYSSEDIEGIYGIDYATNLREVMEVDPRSSTIDKYINAYLFLYEGKNISKANEMLDSLKKYIGGSIPAKLLEEIELKKEAYKH